MADQRAAKVLTAAHVTLDEIRRIVRKWGPGGKSCRFIEIVLQQDLFGNPLKKVRVPVYEPWQRQSNGAYFDLYNLNY